MEKEKHFCNFPSALMVKVKCGLFLSAVVWLVIIFFDRWQSFHLQRPPINVFFPRSPLSSIPKVSQHFNSIERFWIRDYMLFSFNAIQTDSTHDYSTRWVLVKWCRQAHHSFKARVLWVAKLTLIFEYTLDSSILDALENVILIQMETWCKRQHSFNW